MGRVLILDLSNNNDAGVDFKRIKAAGFEGVYLKRSEGTGFVDQTFGPKAAGARAAGLRVGGYHFAHPGKNSAYVEARFFAGLMHGEIHRRDLRPVLDMEVEADPSGVFSHHFSQTTRSMQGVLPLFYSYPAFIEQMHVRNPVGAGLWLASYGRNDGKEYPFSVPAPWHRVVLHQFTANGHVPGVPSVADVSSAPKLRPLLAHPILGIK